MNEGWLEDRLGLLTNFYITLMQAEVDRYQDTIRLLRDYYVGMEGIVVVASLFCLAQWSIFIRESGESRVSEKQFCFSAAPRRLLGGSSGAPRR